MNEFKYYDSENAYGELYWQFPKVLIFNKKYKKLSADAKLTYMLFNDRLSYSLKSNWVDEDDHVYFIYTNNDLKDLLGCSNDKVDKIKKDLVEFKLLKIKRMGQNKANRMYLGRLDVDATDVFLKNKSASTADNSGLLNFGSPKDVDNRGVLNFGSPNISTEQSSKSADNSGLLNFGHDLYRENTDTNRYNKESIDSQNTSLNNDLLKHLPELLDSSPLNQEGLELLSMWVSSVDQAQHMIGIMFNAKKAIEIRESDLRGKPYKIVMEYMQPELTKGLRRYINAARNPKLRIKNEDNYLFGVFKAIFEDYVYIDNQRMSNEN